MIRIFFVGLMGLAAVTMATGEVVEEEAWYNADGKVVKTVKRTLTGADARKGSDWEPAWVLRERRKSSGSVRYSSSRRHGYGRYGYRSYWRSGYYGRRIGCYVSPYRYPRHHRIGGFAGYSGGALIYQSHRH